MNIDSLYLHTCFVLTLFLHLPTRFSTYFIGFNSRTAKYNTYFHVSQRLSETWSIYFGFFLAVTRTIKHSNTWNILCRLRQVGIIVAGKSSVCVCRIRYKVRQTEYIFRLVIRREAICGKERTNETVTRESIETKCVSVCIDVNGNAVYTRHLHSAFTGCACARARARMSFSFRRNKKAVMAIV